jgi:hypothetical protein
LYALAAKVKRRIVSTPIVDIPDLQPIEELEETSTNKWKITTGVFTYERLIYLPKDDLFHIKATSLFHDNPASGHFRAPKTAELVSRDVYCLEMHGTIRK